MRGPSCTTAVSIDCVWSSGVLLRSKDAAKGGCLAVTRSAALTITICRTTDLGGPDRTLGLLSRTVRAVLTATFSASR